MEYRKKPIVIEAVQLKEDTNMQKNPKWFQEAMDNDTLALWCNKGKVLYAAIYTLEGEMTANIGDYIIKGVNGELYPCKPDIFEKTYEIIGAETTITLNKQELDHIINDMLDYIDKIADKCAPDKFVFYHLKKGEILTDEETAELKSWGFFERKELIEKLKRIKETNYPEYTCNG